MYKTSPERTYIINKSIHMEKLHMISENNDGWIGKITGIIMCTSLQNYLRAELVCGFAFSAQICMTVFLRVNQKI